MTQPSTADGQACCRRCLGRSLLIGRLAPRMASAEARWRIPPRRLLGGSDDDLAATLGPHSLQRWLDELDEGAVRERLAGAGVDYACRHSSAYPALLLQLADPPTVLYSCGGLDRLETLAARPGVTVVGGRRATPYALEVATALGRELAEAGATVVSGLALGVDAAAHRGATGADGRAIAVLASGADVPYPRANAGLYRKVRDAGAVVSEMPPGTRPMPWAFPARNRIMAALGTVTVVVEAGDRSGSLITARHATDLGREVGAIPGRVTTARAKGSNRLLRDGATVFLEADDVLDALFGPGSDASGGPRWPRSGGEQEERGAARGLDPPILRVLEAVDSGHGVDAIGREAGVPPGTVRAALGRLELLGLVKRDGLGHYQRTAGR